MVLSLGQEIQPEEPALSALGLSEPIADTSRYQTRLEAVEQEVLQERGEDQWEVSRALGIGSSTLYANLKWHQL